MKSMTRTLKDVKQSIKGWRNEINTLRARRFLSKRVSRLLSKRQAIKLVSGAATDQHYDDWLMTNLPSLDALNVEHFKSIFSPGCIDRILAEHVVEHWHECELHLFLHIVRPYLLSTGVIRLAVPDGFHPDPGYVAAVRPGETGPGAEDHKVLYTHRQMADLLAKARYTCRLLEYFDEQGRFHQFPWLIDDGFIMRSADHDPRNKIKPLSYTSLIVDATPEPDRGGDGDAHGNSERENRL
jgi:predicted SAM-dependent methyltransferase